MDPITISGIFSIGSKLIDRFFPDKAASDAAKLELLKMQQTGELAQLAADTALASKQADTNIEEAKSDRLFIAGWRPFVGWTCGLAFFFKYIGGPGIFVLAQLIAVKMELPEIDTMEMMPILFGMLGLGAYRTFEKTRK